MYSRPFIYKGYSIAVLIIALVNFFSSIFYVFKTADTAYKLFDFIGFESGTTIVFFIQTILIIASLLGLFFSYMDFSSMFTFAKMIEHKNSNSTSPMERVGCAFSPNTYRRFGSVILTINTAILMIAAVIEIIASSISKEFFLCLPVISILVYAIEIFLIYIVYYVKYKTFGDLYEIVTTKEPSSKLIQDIKSINPNLLRGYCTFLYILDILISIGVIVLLFFISSPIISLFGTGAGMGIIISIIIVATVIVLSTAVIGCYFDNLAKMLEHYQIKFKKENI